MISGAHVILYSSDAEADKIFFRDILRFPNVDAGSGWLIFALPPSELAVHPGENNGATELYFMCNDIEEFVNLMSLKNIPCEPVSKQRWGLLTSVTLPGGSRIGVYQPLHPRH